MGTPQDNRARLKQWLSSGEVSIHPLTYPQRELWEASPHPASDVSNHVCALIHVRALLTPQGCEAAVQRVVDRQEVLRLSILPGKEQPMQMVRTTGKPMLHFRELPQAQRNPEAFEELANEIFQTPFDLVQGPLYRAEIFRKSAEDHVLVLAIHHAIADGWTLGVFVQDLFAAYMQGVNAPTGSRAGVQPVPLTYTQWGASERAFWQPKELAQRTSYWRPHLAGAPRLWAGNPSGALQRKETQITPDLGRAVREMARRQGATLFSTLLTAFQIALAKWTGVDDIVVGTPVANRNKQTVRATMGYCSSIVPIRGQVDRARSFAESLRLVHQDAVESFANAMPFAELARGLGEASAPGRNPVFQVRFALQNHPVPDIEANGLSLQLKMRSTGTARFDLACEINEDGEALDVAWLFKADAFALDAIQNLGRMYLAALASACRLPETRNSTLSAALR